MQFGSGKFLSIRCATSLVAVLLAPACAPEPQPYDEVADIKQLMLSVIEPASDIYWQSVGTIMTLEGTENIAPETFAEWEAVRNAAMVLAESGNLLMLPGRRQDDPQWVALSQSLIARSRLAMDAAKSRDPSAVFEAGGELYVVCNECHANFAPDALNSSFKLED